MRNFIYAFLFFVKVSFVFSQEVLTNARDIQVTSDIYKNFNVALYNDSEILKAGTLCNFEKGSEEQFFCDFFNLANNEEFLSFFCP